LELRKIVTQFLKVATGTTLARGIALANTVIIARMLTPSGYGVFAIFYSIMMLAWLFPQAFDGMFVSLAKKTNDLKLKNEYLKNAIVLKTAYSVLLLILAYPLALLIGKYVFNRNDLVIPIICAFVGGSFIAYLKTIASIYQEAEKYGRFAAMHAIYTFGVLLGLIAFVVSQFEFTLNRILALYLCVSVAIGLVSIGILINKTGKVLEFKRDTLFLSFREGKWLFFSVVTYCIFERMDILFLPMFVSNEKIGEYAVAAQLISVIGLATGSMASIFLPKASLAIATKEAFSNFKKESAYGIIIIEIGIMLFFALAPFVVTTLYGSQYYYATKILRILLIGLMGSVPVIPFMFVFLALEETKTRFILELLKLLIGAVLLRLMIPAYGSVGAAYSIAVTLFVSSFLAIILLWFKLKSTVYKTEAVSSG
jgi:O-antigen/teichoic acid export membrane protein